MRSGCKLLDELDHLLEMIEILPVHDQVHGKRNGRLANLLGQDDLKRMALGACNPVRAGSSLES